MKGEFIMRVSVVFVWGREWKVSYKCTQQFRSYTGLREMVSYLYQHSGVNIDILDRRLISGKC